MATVVIISILDKYKLIFGTAKYKKFLWETNFTFIWRQINLGWNWLFSFVVLVQWCLTLRSHRLQHARLPYPNVAQKELEKPLCFRCFSLAALREQVKKPR